MNRPIDGPNSQPHQFDGRDAGSDGHRKSHPKLPSTGVMRIGQIRWTIDGVAPKADDLARIQPTSIG